MNIRLYKRLDLRWLAAVLLSLTVLIPSIAVQAQSETLLQAIPEVDTVPAGNQVLFCLEVTDGVNVNAFDVSIAYDKDKLELTSWKYGGYLSNLSRVYEKKEPGFFRLAATQRATPPVSDYGVLLELIFTAKAAGTAVVEITEAEFADPDGNLINPSRESGHVTVTNAPTYTATPTLTQTTDPSPKGTQTPTKTKTPTRTRTATRARTPTPTRTTWSSSGEETTLTATRTLSPSALSEGEESTSQGYPIVGGESGYPIQAVTTLTETTTAADSTSVSGIDPMAEDDPASEEDNRTEEGSNGAVIKTSQAGWLNITLWGVLILASVAIVIMLIILIKRRSEKTEDLLL
jgi:hypothetical protein